MKMEIVFSILVLSWMGVFWELSEGLLIGYHHMDLGKFFLYNQISTWTPQLSTFMSASMRWWGTSLVGWTG